MKKVYVALADDGTVAISMAPPVGYIGPFDVPDDFEQNQFLYRLSADGALAIDTEKAEAHRVESLSIELRNKRDVLLAATDHYMTVDYPISTEKRAELLVYRQALRDITAQKEWPDEVVWPGIEL